MAPSHRMYNLSGENDRREDLRLYWEAHRQEILDMAPKVPWPVEPFDEVSDITPEQWAVMLARLHADR